jgi:cell division protein FtsB
MKRGNFFVVLLSVLAVVAAIFSIVSQQARLNELRKKQEELEGLVIEYRDKVDGLKYELEREIDDEYIARVARERLGYYKIGEKIYTPGDDGKYGK